VLLASAAVYTTWTTVRFVTGPQSDAPHQNEKVYALPYNRAKLDADIWRDRIRDATTAVDAIRRGSEPHLFFYGFSILGEDSVNPQMFVSRSEEHTSELQSLRHLVCRLLLEKKKTIRYITQTTTNYNHI